MKFKEALEYLAIHDGQPGVRAISLNGGYYQNYKKIFLTREEINSDEWRTETMGIIDYDVLGPEGPCLGGPAEEKKQ